MEPLNRLSNTISLIMFFKDCDEISSLAVIAFVLILIIIILVLGGLLWFDYLGIINAKSVFSPVYKLMGKDVQTSVTSSQSKPL